MQVSSVKNKLHQLKNLQDFNLAIVIKMEFVFGVCGVCGVGFLITPRNVGMNSYLILVPKKHLQEKSTAQKKGLSTKYWS